MLIVSTVHVSTFFPKFHDTLVWYVCLLGLVTLAGNKPYHFLLSSTRGSIPWQFNPLCLPWRRLTSWCYRPFWSGQRSSRSWRDWKSHKKRRYRGQEIVTISSSICLFYLSLTLANLLVFLTTGGCPSFYSCCYWLIEGQVIRCYPP